MKKIFPFFFQRKRYKGRPVEAASPETKFLSWKEVKEAQSESFSGSVSSPKEESTKIIDAVRTQQRPPIPLHRKRQKSFGHKVRRFFRKITFREHSHKHAAAALENYQYFSREDIKKAREEQESIMQKQIADPGRVTPALNIDLEQQKAASRRKRKKRSRSIFRFFKKKHKENPIRILKPGEFLEETKPIASWKVYIRPVLNSTAMFMIAYQLCWLMYQLAVMIVASFSNIDSVLYYYEVMFPVGDSSPKWNQANIIFITLSGPMISLTMWLLYKFLVLRRYHLKQQMRMLVVWLYLHSMMLFFGAFVGGAITRQGFGYVVDWLYMNIAVRILFSLLFLTIIIWISWKIAQFLPESSGDDSWKNNRIGYILSRLTIPWLLGGSIMILLKLTKVVPQHENIFNYDAFNLATLLFAVVPPLFNTMTRPHLIQNRKTYPRVHRATVAIWLLVAIVLIALIRLGLNTGLHFQMHFSVHMNWYR